MESNEEYLKQTLQQDESSDSDFFMKATQNPQEYKQEVPAYKSYPAAILRGLAEGTIGFGEAVGSKILPQSAEESTGQQNRQQFYEENLPIGENFGPRATERAAQHVPALASGGASLVGTLARSGIAGLSGEAAKEFGFGDRGQFVAELPALVGPDLAKTIPVKASQKELADFARKMGMTEEELALTLGKKGSVADEYLSHMAPKGGRTAKAFDATKAALGRMWNTLENTKEAQTPLTGLQSSKFVNELSKKLSQLPDASAKLIEADYKRLLSSEMTGKDIIKFHKDVNYHVNKGERNLGILKGDIQNVLKEISPKLGDDFRMTNELYKNYATLAEQMAPNIADPLIRAGESGILITGLVTGNYPLLATVLGTVSARELAREMVINPRLKNLSQRFLTSAKNNNVAVARSVHNQMVRELGKKNADAAMQLSKFDVDSFIESMEGQENSEE